MCSKLSLCTAYANSEVINNVSQATPEAPPALEAGCNALQGKQESMNAICNVKVLPWSFVQP